MPEATPRLVLYSTNTWESPLVTLRVAGPAQGAGISLVKGYEGDQIYPEKVTEAAVVLIQRDFPRHAEAYTQIMTEARRHGRPVIYDLDDLLFELPEGHPDRETHYYSQALLPMLEAVVHADLVTASTPLLCDYLRLFNPNIRLLPNYLNDWLWKLRRREPPDEGDSPIVLGYIGGDSHLPDLQYISPALRSLLQRYGDQLLFRCIGARIPAELLDLPNIAWIPSKTYVYADFAADLLEQNFDIFIAPLKDNLFNRCKSSIKFLEYSALGVPGVYSRLESYAGVVDHGENGFLASTLEEWEEYLSRLIETPAARDRIGRNAQKTVREGWLLSEHASQWPEVYSQAQALAGMSSTPSVAPPVNTFLRLAEQVQVYNRQLQAKEQALLAEMVEKDRAIQTLSLRSEMSERAVRAQTTQFAEERRQLFEIYSSNTWKLVQMLWRTRLWIAPHGSLRERSLRLLFQGLKSLKNRGLAPFVRNSSLRMRPFQPPTLNRPALKDQPGSQSERTVEALPGLPAPPATDSSNAGSPAAPEAQLELQILNGSGPKAAPRSHHYDVIIFPVMEWASRVQRPQQLALQFARSGHRVFYMYTSFRVGESPQVQLVQENIFEVRLNSPHPVNIYTGSLDEELQVALQDTFGLLRRTFGIGEAVCLVDLPFWTPLALCLRNLYGWKVVYDCMDYHQGFSTNSEQMLETEDTLAKESDLILVTSHLLFSRNSELNPNCLLVPNAADFEHFRFPPLNLPVELKEYPHPVIGFYGAIADWFDVELIESLAVARPGWTFLLIGSTRYANVTSLENLPNVHLLGELPYSVLPQYLHVFDVGIIPFKKQPLTEATNPVKMFEYMSAGKPVVATELDEIRYFAGHVRLASTSQEWLDSIEGALVDTSPQSIYDRINFARQNTWQERVNRIKRAIQAIYPRVSIIVVTYNNADYTRLCLQSLSEKSGYPHFELVVVDNASQDGTQEYLKAFAQSHPDVKLVLNEANEGFARGNNLGAAVASGDYLIFLNNDTVVTPGWISGLLKHLQDGTIGIVGPVTNWAGNESQIPVDYHSLQDLDEFAARYTAGHARQTTHLRVLPFFCVALRRSTFNLVGPLDERFGLGMFEDDDYALRVRQKGLKVICAEDVFIHHWGRTTFAQIDPQAYQQLFEDNRQKFEQKWGVTWEPHRYRWLS